MPTSKKTLATNRPRKSSKTAAVSLSAISIETGIARESLRKWKAEGIDIGDRKALLERAAQRKISTAGDIGELKREKIRLECQKLRAAIEREEGRVIEIAIVHEALVRIAANVRSILLGWRGTLPGMLEGLDASAIHKILDHEINAILDRLHDEAKKYDSP